MNAHEDAARRRKAEALAAWFDRLDDDDRRTLAAGFLIGPEHWHLAAAKWILDEGFANEVARQVGVNAPSSATRAAAAAIMLLHLPATEPLTTEGQR